MKKERFFTDLHNYLSIITKDNFSKMYDGLKEIVIKYNLEGLSRRQIINLLESYGKLPSYPIDEYQEEVLIEIQNRLSGLCAPRNYIELKE